MHKNFMIVKICWFCRIHSKMVVQKKNPVFLGQNHNTMLIFEKKVFFVLKSPNYDGQKMHTNFFFGVFAQIHPIIEIKKTPVLHGIFFCKVWSLLQGKFKTKLMDLQKGAKLQHYRRNSFSVFVFYPKLVIKHVDILG